MSSLRIERLTDVEAVRELAKVARSEGFAFLDRLISEWVDGTNRFARSDEILFGAFVDGRLVGTAGLTFQRARTGRVRRVYVHPDYRRQGIAGALMAEVLSFAQDRYIELVLFAETPEAFRLYERLGFVFESSEGPDHATHRRASPSPCV
jgi:GNAT superfamily N-acetyltransferase